MGAPLQELNNDPKSDLREWRLDGGPGFYIARNLGSGRTHVIRADDPEARAYIGEIFRSIGWFLEDGAKTECGVTLKRTPIIMNPETRINCPTCKYIYEGWI
jgi:hypothetical protein